MLASDDDEVLFCSPTASHSWGRAASTTLVYDAIVPCTRPQTSTTSVGPLPPNEEPPNLMPGCVTVEEIDDDDTRSLPDLAPSPKCRLKSASLIAVPSSPTDRRGSVRSQTCQARGPGHFQPLSPCFESDLPTKMVSGFSCCSTQTHDTEDSGSIQQTISALEDRPKARKLCELSPEDQNIFKMLYDLLKDSGFNVDRLRTVLEDGDQNKAADACHENDITLMHVLAGNPSVCSQSIDELLGRMEDKSISVLAVARAFPHKVKELKELIDGVDDILDTLHPKRHVKLTPLHVLAANPSIGLDCWRALLSGVTAEVQSQAIVDKSGIAGKNVLHFLFEGGNAPAHVVSGILESSPSTALVDALTSRDDAGDTPVHALARLESMDTMVVRSVTSFQLRAIDELEENEDVLRVQAVKALWGVAGQGGRTPLHCLLRNDRVDATVAQAVFETLPASLLADTLVAKDDGKRTPVRYLTQNGSLSEKLVEALMCARSSAMKVLQGCDLPRFECLKTLWSTPDDAGFTPLQYLMLGCTNETVLRAVLDPLPAQLVAEALTATTVRERTPIHWLLKGGNFNVNVVGALMSNWHRASSDLERSGDLHHLEILRSLWVKSALSGRTPLHLLMLSSKLNAAMMRSVLEPLPASILADALAAENDDNETPIHLIAKHRGITAELLDTLMWRWVRARKELVRTGDSERLQVLETLWASPDFRGRTPMFNLLANLNVNVAVARAVFNPMPSCLLADAMCFSGEDQQTPIHALAGNGNLNAGLADLLVSACLRVTRELDFNAESTDGLRSKALEAAWITPDKSGNTPLHHYSLNDRTDSGVLKAVAKLFNGTSNDATRKENGSCGACVFGPAWVVSAVGAKRDVDKSTPLHTFASNSKLDMEMTLDLLEMRPRTDEWAGQWAEALFATDNNGDSFPSLISERNGLCDVSNLILGKRLGHDFNSEFLAGLVRLRTPVAKSARDSLYNCMDTVGEAVFKDWLQGPTFIPEDRLKASWWRPHYKNVRGKTLYTSGTAVITHLEKRDLTIIPDVRLLERLGAHLQKELDDAEVFFADPFMSFRVMTAFFANCSLYLATPVMYCCLVFQLTNQPNLESGQSFPILDYATGCMGAGRLIWECVQFLNYCSFGEGWKCISDPWNIVAVVSAVLVLATCVWANVSATESPSNLLACASLTTWLATFDFLRIMNRGFASLIRCLILIVVGVKTFCFLLAIVLMAFVQSFFVYLSAEELETHDEDHPFETGQKSAMTVFAMLFGDFDLDAFQKPLAIILFAVFMMATVIVMLNTLIAIAGDVYDNATSSSHRLFAASRLEAVIDIWLFVKGGNQRSHFMYARKFIAVLVMLPFASVIILFFWPFGIMAYWDYHYKYQGPSAYGVSTRLVKTRFHWWDGVRRPLYFNRSWLKRIVSWFLIGFIPPDCIDHDCHAWEGRMHDMKSWMRRKLDALEENQEKIAQEQMARFSQIEERQLALQEKQNSVDRALREEIGAVHKVVQSIADKLASKD